MQHRITIIGSTGLIGKHFLTSTHADDYQSVRAITRRTIPELEEKTFITQAIHDFSNLEDMRPDLQCDVLVCTLGTTIKIAGSQERFFQVDHDIPLTLAKMAREEGCQTFILVSSIGAHATSRVFYSRVKGQLEEDLQDLGFTRLIILRPSMLLGKRQDSRAGEKIASLIMKPLAFMFPRNYRPIEARTVAAKIHQLIKGAEKGTLICSGKCLFNIN